MLLPLAKTPSPDHGWLNSIAAHGSSAVLVARFADVEGRDMGDKKDDKRDEKGSSSSKVSEQEYVMTEYGFKRYNICGMKFEVLPNFTVKKAVGQVAGTCGLSGPLRGARCAAPRSSLALPTRH